jgi:hypothetical protein
VPVTFKARLEGDASGALVEVPPDVLEALGSPTKRPAVRVTINGAELRTTLAVYGGRSLIGLRRDYREAAHIAPGETIEVEVELDTAPRSVAVPDDLAAALAADERARAIFDGLSFTHRSEYVRWITSAKRAETRQRRVREAPELLRNGRRTPL